MNLYIFPFKKVVLQRLVFTTLTCLMCLAFSASAKSRREINQQFAGRQDTLSLLQQCLDLPIIQKYYTRHTDGTAKQVYIMQYPVRFPDGIEVSKFGQPVMFRSRAGIRSDKAEVFLIFKSFSINGDDASVSFTLNSDYTTKPNILEVTLQLHRSGGAWTIDHKQIRRLI
jgi:hypothetical protein